MNYQIRPAIKSDEPFLWQMLYYAAHMDEDGASLESAKTNPDLMGYVEHWGERAGDLGFIAQAPDGEAAGAAWVRVMPDDSPLYQVVARGIPELAIAIAPEHIGKGAGELLLRHLLEAARGSHRAIILSVRADNPAKRLYERLGFLTVAEIKNRVGTASFVMKVPLD
jgi:ribosomal protein S18 acetylase RimI-like enzyme